MPSRPGTSQAKHDVAATISRFSDLLLLHLSSSLHLSPSVPTVHSDRVPPKPLCCAPRDSSAITATRQHYFQHGNPPEFGKIKRRRNQDPLELLIDSRPGIACASRYLRIAHTERIECALNRLQFEKALKRVYQKLTACFLIPNAHLPQILQIRRAC